MRETVQKAITPIQSDRVLLEHYTALESLLARDGWAGESWFKTFAADSIRIGEALGSLREDVSKEQIEHKRRMNEGFGALSKLHCVLMCSAAARALAESIEEEDLTTPKGQALSPRQNQIVLAGSRSFGQINDAEKHAFIAALNLRLSERLSLGFVERVEGLAQLMSQTENFTAVSKTILISLLTHTVLPMHSTPADNGPAYAASQLVPPEQLLNKNHLPNDLLMEATLYAIHLFNGDPSFRLESRFYGLYNVHLYDNAEFSTRYPNGVFDGTILLLPVGFVSQGYGTGKVFESAMAALSTAARQSLGLEDSPNGIYRMETGILHETLISAGMLLPAKKLTISPAQQERVEIGFDAADVANALREACVEGLGLPVLKTIKLPAQTRLDTALREAVWLELGEKAEELLQEGANPKAVSTEGTSALMMAAAAGSFEWVERLAPMSEPEAVDRYGRSASHYAKMHPTHLGLAEWLAACARSVVETHELLDATEPNAVIPLKLSGGARL